MKTIKRVAALLAAVLMTLSLGMALAAQTDARVFDRANLFTPAQEDALAAAIAAFQTDNDFTFFGLIH